MLVSQRACHVAQTLSSLGVISIEDDETRSAFLVKKVCAQGDLTSGGAPPLVIVTTKPSLAMAI